ncbi:MAG: hypothetical protein BWZ10_01355 [candidate division BRC1 bacterium ADurb.BinA364]|nr:MAG: hypothetical protein BWZ10_01355 [candidate division BRC1 bacterium ADurb.BinA364]
MSKAPAPPRLSAIDLRPLQQRAPKGVALAGQFRRAGQAMAQRIRGRAGQAVRIRRQGFEFLRRPALEPAANNINARPHFIGAGAAADEVGNLGPIHLRIRAKQLAQIHKQPQIVPGVASAGMVKKRLDGIGCGKRQVVQPAMALSLRSRPQALFRQSRIAVSGRKPPVQFHIEWLGPMREFAMKIVRIDFGAIHDPAGLALRARAAFFIVKFTQQRFRRVKIAFMNNQVQIGNMAQGQTGI